MYSVLKSYGLNGLNGFAVAVEADVSGGLPAFSLVGLPDSAVRESGDRVRSAMKNLGYKWPDRHITVNLAPADIRKSGPVYDLPLLLAVLASSGQMEEPPADAAFLGELALDGSLRPVSGVLPMALAAAADGIRSLYVPAENAAEAAEAGGDAMQVYPARTAREVVDALRGLVPLSPAAPIPFDPASGWNAAPDFADVMGQPLAHGAGSSRWAQRTAHRRARHRQIHAGQAPARHPAAPDPGGSCGDHQDLFHCGPAAQGAGPDLCPALPQPAPHDLGPRPDGRRLHAAPG